MTCCTFQKHRLFADATVVDPLAVQIRQSCADRQFELMAYVFMPDHLHLLVAGLASTSDFSRLMRLIRARTAMTYRTLHHSSLWQDGYFERVLRSNEDTAIVARYIVGNPVRAGLVQRANDYPFVFCWQPID